MAFGNLQEFKASPVCSCRIWREALFCWNWLTSASVHVPLLRGLPRYLITRGALSAFLLLAAPDRMRRLNVLVSGSVQRPPAPSCPPGGRTSDHQSLQSRFRVVVLKSEGD